jgi:hypothetical protein
MPFPIQTQLEEEWCWAAVAASVDNYFNPISSVPQCRIATNVLNKDACGDPEECNLSETLQKALKVVDRLRGIRIGPLTFAQLRQEIDAGHPVCARIAWNDGGAHFVVISGYYESPAGVRTVDISDPWYPNSIRDFDQFPGAYHGGGKWTATFLVKPKRGERGWR